MKLDAAERELAGIEADISEIQSRLSEIRVTEAQYTAIGVATDNLSMCMCLGVSFGLCIGSVIDARNRAKAKEKAEKGAA